MAMKQGIRSLVHDAHRTPIIQDISYATSGLSLDERDCTNPGAKIVFMPDGGHQKLCVAVNPAVWPVVSWLNRGPDES
jgi:hypothetical protein